jgi:hypothetical protein
MDDPEYLQITPGGYSLYPMHDSLRLLDAHLIFEPLLSCLGVMPQQMVSNLSGSTGMLLTLCVPVLWMYKSVWPVNISSHNMTCVRTGCHLITHNIKTIKGK